MVGWKNEPIIPGSTKHHSFLTRKFRKDKRKKIKREKQKETDKKKKLWNCQGCSGPLYMEPSS